MFGVLLTMLGLAWGLCRCSDHAIADFLEIFFEIFLNICQLPGAHLQHLQVS